MCNTLLARRAHDQKNTCSLTSIVESFSMSCIHRCQRGMGISADNSLASRFLYSLGAAWQSGPTSRLFPAITYINRLLARNEWSITWFLEQNRTGAVIPSVNLSPGLRSQSDVVVSAHDAPAIDQRSCCYSLLLLIKAPSPSMTSISFFSSFTTCAALGPLLRSWRSFCKASSEP